MAPPRNRLAHPRRGGTLVFLLLSVLVIAGGAAATYYLKFRPTAEISESQLIMRAAERGRFDHIVLERGEIDSSSNVEVICEVKSRAGGGTGGTAILWVIDEGTYVNEGDKLVELDSSQLDQEFKQQRILVTNAEASLASAEAMVQQARIAKQEYLEGLFKSEEKLIESEIAVAQQELRKAQLSLRSTEKMVAKGLVTSLQLEADQFAMINTRNQLEAAEGRLKVLQNLTRERMLVQFDSEIEAAQAAREAARSTLLEEKDKLEDIETQIKACVMYAPSDGVVVHANRYSSRGGSAEFVVEPGAIVRERQTIIRLPDPTKMQVNAKINESRITLVREGMPCRIRVDAVDGLELVGRVKKVNRYAEPSSWYSSSIKEYGTAIEISDPPDAIRTGMTAEVRIFVDQQEDALQIPIQGVYEHQGRTYTLLRTNKGFETRTIDLGATNDKMATIRGGLSEGDRVVLNLRSFLDLLDLPQDKQDDREQLAKLSSGVAEPPEEAPAPNRDRQEWDRQDRDHQRGAAPSDESGPRAGPAPTDDNVVAQAPHGEGLRGGGPPGDRSADRPSGGRPQGNRPGGGGAP